MKKLLAEFLGTFFLVFAGTGAIVVDHASGGEIGHVGISMVFGLVVMVMIQTFGDVSGAHFNPAVTLGFAVAGRIEWKNTWRYAIAQFIGAFAGSGLLRLLFPDSPTLGETLPIGGVVQAFVLEIALTGTLMLVILYVSIVAREKQATAGMVIGSVVLLGAMFAGPISGASMNPARSLAPAIINANFDYLWLYPIAAIIGALLAVPLCIGTRGAGCCR